MDGVVSKVCPMRSHTVAAEGGAVAVITANDSLDAHARDTITGSDWLADQDAVEAFVQEAPAEMTQLEHWGCPWSREPDGHVAVRPFGGMKIERTWFAADKTGFHMLHALFQTSQKYDNVTRYDEWFVTRLLVDDGRVQGVAAIELLTGRLRAVAGKAVILCTAGAGRIFPFPTNPADKTGDPMPHAPSGVVDVDPLDVRPPGEKKINKKNPFPRELAKNYVGIDPVYQPIPVRPVVHYMMGGVSTDKDGATTVSGLFAAGECACVSLNGANRLGTDSMTE